MVKQSSRQIIFFLIFFLLIFLGVKAMKFWAMKMPDYNTDLITIIVGIIVTLFMVILYKVGKICPNSSGASEGFWDVSLAAKCKGGPFFWEGGDSELSEECRKMAETSEGRCALSSYNCPKGFIGTPKTPFLYTPLSDDNWNNERCDDTPTCPCDVDGLCSMIKRVE